MAIQCEFPSAPGQFWVFLDEDVQLSSRFVGQEVVFCCMVKNRGRKRKGKSSPPASLCFPIPGRAVELDFLVDHVRAQIQDEEAARRPLLRLCEEIVARIPVCHPIGSLVFFVDADAPRHLQPQNHQAEFKAEIPVECGLRPIFHAFCGPPRANVSEERFKERLVCANPGNLEILELMLHEHYLEKDFDVTTNQQIRNFFSVKRAILH